MNLHPVFDRMVSRSEHERRLGQRGRVIWFTGLSGSGKSTLAIALAHRLFDEGYSAQVLDGDNIRTGINNNLGFSSEDRTENIRRIAEVSRLFVSAGVITLNCFISPLRSMRALAKEIIGSEDFMEIYISTPLEVCEARDVKGLYAKARRGEIPDFTGVHAPFEPPEHPAIVIDTRDKSVDVCTTLLYQSIQPSIRYA